MQIPILQGIYTDNNSDFRTSYPKNVVPVLKQSGISEGYFRPAEGIVEFIGSCPGLDRGGINWNGICYRVMGSKLITINSNGTYTILGDVENDTKPVTFDYSFDRLAVASNQKLFYWDGVTLTEVTDPDLGIVLDFIWVDGYFMTTDGEYLVVTELADPTQVDPLKYGSSEVDPDPIVAIKKIRGEPYAINKYSIETFDNVGGSGFPFQRIDGAHIDKGSIGTKTCCVLDSTIAFIGGGRNEPPAVWVAVGGSYNRISNREIEQVLQGYTEDQIADMEIETRSMEGHDFLYIHFPDKTYVYDARASQLSNQPTWHKLCSSFSGEDRYNAKHFVYCYDKWLIGHPGAFSIGSMVSNISSHWGAEVGWEFNTIIIYSEGKNAVVNQLELVVLTGRSAYGDDPTVWTSYSNNGLTWSPEKPVKAGIRGQYDKRLVWLNQGLVNQWRTQKFRGTSECHLSVVRLEAEIELLQW